MKIRPAALEDAPAICSIYNHFVARTIVSFEEQPVSTEQMQLRITRITRNYPWLVVEAENRVIGYAYVDLWQERSAYRNTLITTMYFQPDHTGRGYGTKLYQALFDALHGSNCHTLVAGISLPNAASVALHHRLGFEKVAHFKEVGRKMGQWIDVGYWQKHLTY